MSDDAERIVPVVIHGQRYPVRSALQATYVAELAAYVDEKIRVAADENQTNDSLRVAVLAALNLADEVFRYRQDRVANAGAIASRAGEIERLVDAALEERPAFAKATAGKPTVSPQRRTRHQALAPLSTGTAPGTSAVPLSIRYNTRGPALIVMARSVA